MSSWFRSRFAAGLRLSLVALLVLPVALRAAIVYEDHFDDGDVDNARYTALGGAILVEAQGRLDVQTPVAGPGGNLDGVRINLENLPGGEAICHKLQLSTDGNINGSFIKWKWWVREGVDGTPYTLLESEWTVDRPNDFPEDAAGAGAGGRVAFYVKTTKLDARGNPHGRKVYEAIPKDLKGLLLATSQWDRRNPVPSEEEVQLEFFESDGVIVKLFPWRDPPPTTTVWFDVCTDLDVLHFESVVVEDEHVESQNAPQTLIMPNARIQDCETSVQCEGACYFVELNSQTEVLGLQLGLRWDPADAINVMAIRLGPDTPDGPLFFNANIEGRGVDDGAALIGYAPRPGDVIPPGDRLRILEIDFELSPGTAPGTPVRFCFADGLGNPPLNTRLTVREDGAPVSIAPETRCGVVTFIEDTTPPVLSTPERITVDCPDPGVTVVHFEVSAEDSCEPVSIECVPPSGSEFQPGVTNVICTATDAAGNSVTDSFEVEVAEEACFRRAEINADGRVDLSDPISLLEFLFQAGDGFDCADAADVNDDGNIDISDATYTFSFLFLGGPDPRLPFPGCGMDPSEDGIAVNFGPCSYPPEFCD